MNSRSLKLDGNAKSKKTDMPAFLARPEGAPIYHGFPVIEETETDGWKYGAITEFLKVPKGEEHEGDGFVVAPDGSRAGLVWSTDEIKFELIYPADDSRWGVYAVRFPKPIYSMEDLIYNFRAVLPLLKQAHAEKKNGG